MDIKNLCLDIEDWIINVRRDLHKTPELGLKEFQTREKIKKYLDEIGVDFYNLSNPQAVENLLNNILMNYLGAEKVNEALESFSLVRPKIIDEGIIAEPVERELKREEVYTRNAIPSLID